MQRGEIWWAEFPPPVHRHPVVVVSRDASTNGHSTVVVAQITARIRETAAEVPLGAEDGLPKTVINVEMLSTISTANLVSRIACLSPEKLARLDQALRHVLDLPAAESDHPRLPVRQIRAQFGGFSGKPLR